MTIAVAKVPPSLLERERFSLAFFDLADKALSASAAPVVLGCSIAASGLGRSATPAG